jgi:mannose/fructose/N-acetylgalactosamine-specific phosphotransferase system component IID
METVQVLTPKAHQTPNVSQNTDKRHDERELDKILKHPLIDKLYRKNESQRRKIERAVEFLKDEPNSIGLVKTAVDAILADEAKGKVNVFFSHKK